MNNNEATEPETREQANLAQLYRLVNNAGAKGITDIHVKPNVGLYMVKDDNPVKDTDPRSVFPQETIDSWLKSGYSNAPTVDAILGTKGHTSIAYDTGKYRVRSSFRRDTTGVSVTHRVIPYKIPNVDELGVPELLQQLMTKKSGLILIEGSTGSGKSWTIAALIDLINRTSDRHVYLVEDPIEFVHAAQGNSVFTQREIGVHASDFSSAVENALRSSPNIIVIGELLDNATKKAALHAATTGHLVITTAHAGSIVEAIDSFIGEFEPKEQPQIRSRLSQSLLAVMIQQLAPRVSGGRVPVRELALMNESIAGIIRDGEMHMLHGQLEGSVKGFSLEMNLAELVVAGEITETVAMERTRKPDVLEEHITRKRAKQR